METKEWSCSDLTQWMTDTDKFKKEEISLMKGAEISGKSLPMVDHQVLKDIGITSVGRQLEIIQFARCLCEESAVDTAFDIVIERARITSIIKSRSAMTTMEKTGWDATVVGE
ncbi:hypothetical protein pdam_00014205 [Pocillopora damicornis]|uniref:SAM domain-containing protein n=1 Tax=Pocillopora damicornis TaxID=46731 RepID=A0A3M6UGK5_POCDA|nr:hypothetical protein pdam_00014205 [Pocillopora damicornis]